MYILIKYIVLLYKELEINYLNNHAFNMQISYIKIDIEHIFPVFKERLKNLIRIWLIIMNNKKYEFAYI